ncbi:MAG TPA: hypothetical protein VHT50_26700 [Mycobacterium sp.]|nr:hypothetical protein [Mycobacterium sp.]
MPSISPLIVRVFDSPTESRRRRESQRNRVESKGRVAKRRSR